MNRELITPDSEEHWLSLRRQDLTSTDIAALFGLSPYKTAFELWHEKRSGESQAFVENERMRWGNRLEAAIAETLAEQQGWSIRPFKEYGRLPELRIGSSFDFRIMTDTPPGNDMPRDRESDSILEIKNVDWLRFKQGWTVESDWIEAPAHIELQLQHEMLVSGLRRGFLGVLVGGNDTRLIERHADDAVHAAILQRAAKFWKSIDDNDPPSPVMPDDAATVIRLNSHAEPGTLLDARGNGAITELVREYIRIKNEAKDLDGIAEAMKAQLLEQIGEHEKVIGDGFKISAGVVADSPGTLITADMVGTRIGGRSGYRMLRVTQPKK